MAGEKYTNIGKARWENANVGVIKWDPENKAGLASVIDETTGTVYEIGGGGGGGGESDFSTAKVTFINNASEHFILDGVIIFDNKMYPTLDSDDIPENPSTYLLFNGEGTIQPSFESNIVLTGTGNVTFSHNVGTITGDCTITIADVNNQS